MYTQNFQSGAAGNGAADDQDKTRHRSALQREIIMQEADYRRSVSEKVKLESEIRQLKNEEVHTKLSLQEKQTRLARLDQDIARADGELRDLKKKLNTL